MPEQMNIYLINFTQHDAGSHGLFAANLLSNPRNLTFTS